MANAMQWLFHPESQQLSFPAPSVSVAQVWSCVGRNYSIKEKEWGRTTDARGGSNCTVYKCPHTDVRAYRKDK